MGTHPIFESDFDCLTDQHGAVRVLSKSGARNARPLERS